MRFVNRPNVLALGPLPADQTPWEERNLRIVRLKSADEVTDEQLSLARGIVVMVPPDQLSTMRRHFSHAFPKACEMGAATVVIANDSRTIESFRTMRAAAFAVSGASESAPHFLFENWACVKAKIADAAEFLARHNAGPGIFPIPVEIEDLTQDGISPATQKLIQRAFHDCAQVTVRALTGGKTAKETYRVMASLRSVEFGPRPMPFFLKIGGPANICQEMENYRLRAEPFIPFYLRPALNEERSVVTPTDAALVCNFVETGTGLRETLRNNQGHGVVFSLFETTLHGLRSHILHSIPREGIVATFLEKRLKLSEITSGRRQLATDEFRLTRTPEEICAILKAHCGAMKSHSGIYHGDLHAGNVMVRHWEAIVIDFGSMLDTGPITADPAILEVSLLFASDLAEKVDFRAWREFVDELYLQPLTPPRHGPLHPAFAWLLQAIREIRQVVRCCGASDLEALLVLAGALLRGARGSGLVITEWRAEDVERKRAFEDAEKKRAYAIVISEKLAVMLESGAYAKS